MRLKMVVVVAGRGTRDEDFATYETTQERLDMLALDRRHLNGLQKLGGTEGARWMDLKRRIR